MSEHHQPQEQEPSTNSAKKDRRTKPLVLSCPDSEDDRFRSASGQVVEFQQFMPEEERETVETRPPAAEKIRKTFIIDIPQPQSADPDEVQTQKERKCWQPPAPSHKNHQKLPKSFVFPAPPPQNPKQSTKIQFQPSSDDGKSSQQGKDRQIRELILSFDRERQQFYREKSRLQKQLMVKDGQIDILQTTLSSLVEPERVGNKKMKDVQYLQEMISWKDEQINSLIAKVEELDQKLTAQGYELADAQDQWQRVKQVNSTLQNQLFVANTIRQHEQARVSFHQHQYQFEDKGLYTTFYNTREHRPFENNNRCFESDSSRQQHLKMLQKRLETLSEHRKELEERDRSNSFRPNLTLPSAPKKYRK